MKKNVAKDMNPSIFFYEDYFDNIFFTLIPAAATPVSIVASQSVHQQNMY